MSMPPCPPGRSLAKKSFSEPSISATIGCVLLTLIADPVQRLAIGTE